MGKFHINGKGEPGACRAEIACPFGGENEHYDTAADARRAYEKVQEGTAWASVSKGPKPAPAPDARPLPSATERAAAEKAQAANAFAAADYEWRQAMALWDDDSAIHTLTGEQLNELAAKRDEAAARVGAPTSEEARNAMHRARADAIDDDVRKELARTETLARGTSANPDSKTQVTLAYGAQKGYERILRHAQFSGELYARAQGSPQERAANTFLQADLQARIAKAKLDQLPEGNFLQRGRTRQRAEAMEAWTQAHEARKEAYSALRELDPSLRDKPFLPVY